MASKTKTLLGIYGAAAKALPIVIVAAAGVIPVLKYFGIDICASALFASSPEVKVFWFLFLPLWVVVSTLWFLHPFILARKKHKRIFSAMVYCGREGVFSYAASKKAEQIAIYPLCQDVTVSLDPKDDYKLPRPQCSDCDIELDVATGTEQGYRCPKCKAVIVAETAFNVFDRWAQEEYAKQVNEALGRKMA